MVTKQTFIRGGKNAVKVILDLSKYIIPSVFIMKLLEYSGWLSNIAGVFAPFMSYLGLPGEGALVFMFGQVALYSAIGVIMSLDLTAKQITICCAMATMCHVILLESAIVKKAGGNGILNGTIRFIAAIITGIILNLLIPGV